MFRNLRAFFSLGRLPLRTETYLSRQPLSYNVRRVRFVDPFFSRRRLFRAALYTAPVVGVYYYVLPVVLPELEEDEYDDDYEDERDNEEAEAAARHAYTEKAKLFTTNASTTPPPAQAVATRPQGGVGPSYPPSTEDEEDETEDETFLPLGWARPMPSEPYKGTDPEWQEFVKFSRDRERGARVRHELADMVALALSKKKTFLQACGTPLKVRKYWLDFDFPNVPPPEFVRPGILITNDYVAWAWQPVSARDYSRVRHALWPHSMLSSLWASSNAVVQHNVDRIKGALGVKPTGKPSPRTPAGLPVSVLPHSRVGPHDTAANAATESATSKASVGATSPGAASDAVAPTSWPSTPRSDLLPPLPGVPRPTTSESMDVALTAFRRNLARTWRPPREYPPRGSFTVTGLVEVAGPDAMLTLDVRAAYDPRTSRWESLGIGIRRVQYRKQGPLR
ncbi:MAG: hypothetical protein M1838_004923 [Thelocarpon superellum]|nr:MAG: hypothetical protein M1838_004923 [Thelocarpon superellum]